MNLLKKDWQRRTTWIVFISVLTTLAIGLVGGTDWADGFRQVLESQGEHGGPEGLNKVPMILLFVIPLLKVMLMTGVPMTLGIGLARGWRRFAPRLGR